MMHARLHNGFPVWRWRPWKRRGGRLRPMVLGVFYRRRYSNHRGPFNRDPMVGSSSMSRLEFTAPTKRKAHERANGRCQVCDVVLRDGEPQYHHILEARLGGDNALANCLVLCIPCHKVVTKEQSVPRITKMKGMHAGSINAKTPSVPIRSAPFRKSQRSADRALRGPKQALPPKQLYR